MNGNVNIRFYYDQADADTLYAVADRWRDDNAAGTSFVSGLRWFAMNSGTFDPGTADLTDEGIANSTEWFPTTGTEDGFAYAKFSTSTLTGGGLAFSVGTNSVILPVELLTFNAYVIDGDKVSLTWATASEVNNDYFMIERSGDMQHWSDLKQIDGAGNSNVTLYYDHIDRAPLKGRSFYRLRQVDFDGTADHSEVREVMLEDLNSGQIAVYPNPSSGTVYVQIPFEQASYMFVRNALGQAIRTIPTQGNEVIQIDHLPAGVYFLSFGSATESALKFVITAH